MPNKSNGIVEALEPEPGSFEERRRWGECLQDIEKFLTIIHDNAEYFLPGEEVEGFKSAWEDTKGSLQNLRKKFPHTLNGDADSGVITDTEAKELEDKGLTGVPGSTKRSFWGRRYDNFRRFFGIEPKNDRTWKNILLAAEDCAEAGVTILGSIPGGEVAVESGSLVKQALNIRRRRNEEAS